ncbi:MAG: rod shape-determining protein MreD [Clostridia bacterium]|nr:rod shape-determining protein MreD [Clostridia bacterium]
MKRRIWIAVIILTCMLLDNVVLVRLNLLSLKPDAVLALSVCFGLYMGALPAAIIAGGAGLVADLLAGPALGISSIGYILAAVAGSAFRKKYYADNPIIPAGVVFAAAIVKQHVFMLTSILMGAEFSYWGMLASNVLPCALLSAVLGIPMFYVSRAVFVERLKPISLPAKE